MNTLGQYAKAIISFLVAELTAVGTWMGAALPNGVTPEEWGLLVLAIAGGLAAGGGVAVASNQLPVNGQVQELVASPVLTANEHADLVADAVIHRLNMREAAKTTTHHKTPARSD